MFRYLTNAILKFCFSNSLNLYVCSHSPGKWEIYCLAIPGPPTFSPGPYLRLWGAGTRAAHAVCPWRRPSSILVPQDLCCRSTRPWCGAVCKASLGPALCLSESLRTPLGQEKLSAALKQGPRELCESLQSSIYGQATPGCMQYGAMEDSVTSSDVWHSHYCAGASASLGSIREVKRRRPSFYKPTDISKGSLLLAWTSPTQGPFSSLGD